MYIDNKYLNKTLLFPKFESVGLFEKKLILITEKILNTEVSTKNINIDNDKKCFLRIKSAY